MRGAQMMFVGTGNSAGIELLGPQGNRSSLRAGTGALRSGDVFMTFRSALLKHFTVTKKT
jgi:hypothetical protein